MDFVSLTRGYVAPWEWRACSSAIGARRQVCRETRRRQALRSGCLRTIGPTSAPCIKTRGEKGANWDIRDEMAGASWMRSWMASDLSLRSLASAIVSLASGRTLRSYPNAGGIDLRRRAGQKRAVVAVDRVEFMDASEHKRIQPHGRGRIPRSLPPGRRALTCYADSRVLSRISAAIRALGASPLPVSVAAETSRISAAERSCDASIIRIRLARAPAIAQ
jgi:hypothetical protein